MSSDSPTTKFSPPVAVSSPSTPGAGNAAEESYVLDENLPLGALAGLAAMLIGMALWVAVTVATGHQIGYMAVGLGLCIGVSMRWAGRGYSRAFQILGALFSLLGCVLGNLLTGCVLVADQDGGDLLSVLGGLDLGAITAIMSVMFSPLDLLFYALAIGAGWKYAVVKNAR